MPPTDTKEEGLEDTIVNDLKTKNDYEEGTNDDYNKEFALDEKRLFEFLQRTQPKEMDKLGVLKSDAERRQFLGRLNKQLHERGVIDVLRKGLDVVPAGHLTMFYFESAETGKKGKNAFSVTRQLRYSTDKGKLALDLCLFINGLPVITIELKNTLTGQTTKNAVEQYKKDRNPNDILFSFKRCVAHFAVDDRDVKFCTKLAKGKSWFLPFNKGCNGGAGNPPNPNGIKTDYLWKDIFARRKLARIIKHYAHVIEEEDEDGNTIEKQIFPRYHQLDVVEKLLADVMENGVGKRYLIQHSAGSGKSNSIAWLAYQLSALLGEDTHPIFDSVLVVNDRRILDRQTRNTMNRFNKMKHIVEWADSGTKLGQSIKKGKRIIITTVEKFPWIADDMRNMKDKHFAVIIDEAHSGQSGDSAAQMNQALSGGHVVRRMRKKVGDVVQANQTLQGDVSSDDKDAIEKDDRSAEDKINAMAEGRSLPRNASYFAFTATPKNKTEEMFGEPYEEGGKTKRRPFHAYTMKQAIEEGFIMDVLENYTPIDSYYKIIKTVENDSMFDKNRTKKMLRAFVEGNPNTIRKKATIIVDHFLDQVIRPKKIKGQARAMVVTEDIARCVEYYRAIKKRLVERNSPYKAIIAFSGKYDDNTSESINKSFRDVDIPKVFRKDPYRILVVADMFQTGFDEPLLHTMYVDKKLRDVGAVQTLSRLNRCHPDKEDTFVLDFANNAEDIEKAFSEYYKTTILSGETDPNRLYDLVDRMKKHQVYSKDDVERFIDLFLSDAKRETLDPILDACAAIYDGLEKDKQIEFKGAAKSFVRSYDFLAAILPCGNPEWEKLSIFLRLLILKLSSPEGDDLPEGILSMVALDSYRITAREKLSISLNDNDAEISPLSDGTGHISESEPKLDLLSQIISDFNDRFGDIQWSDKDGVRQQIEELTTIVAKDEKFQNAAENLDEQGAKLESTRALTQEVSRFLASDTSNDPNKMELCRQFCNRPDFKEWLSGVVFNITYMKKGRDGTEGSKTA